MKNLTFENILTFAFTGGLITTLMYVIFGAIIAALNTFIL